MVKLLPSHLKESPKMPCRDCSAPAKSSRPSADHEGLWARSSVDFNYATRRICFIIQFVLLATSMLHANLYGLSLYSDHQQTMLDFIFAGSITAVGMQKLRFFFLAISILTLSASIAREGFSRGNIRRAIICAGLLVWTQYSQRVQGYYSCH